MTLYDYISVLISTLCELVWVTDSDAQIFLEHLNYYLSSLKYFKKIWCQDELIPHEVINK